MTARNSRSHRVSVSSGQAAFIASTFAVGIAIGAAGMALANGKEVDFVVPLANGHEIKFKTEAGRLPFLDLFKTLFENEMSTAATQGILEREYHTYEITSPNIVSAIAELPPDDKLSVKLRNMLKSGEGPFQLQSHFFRDIHDETVVKEFDRQEVDKYYDVVNILRDKCLHHTGFCEDRGLNVRVALTDQVAKGEAAICWASQLLGSTAWIKGKLAPQSKLLELNRFFLGCGNPDSLILVNPEDGAELFGSASDGPIETTIYVSPTGYIPVVHKEPKEIAADRSRAVVITQ